MIVIDASIFLAAILDNESNLEAETIASRLRNGSLKAFVPYIFPAEVANGMAVSYRRKRITDEQLAEYIAVYQDFPVIIDTEASISSYTTLAIANNLSTYDAMYLELAKRKNIPLVTLDKRLHEAANKEGLLYQ